MAIITNAKAKEIFNNALVLEDMYTRDEIIEALRVADNAYHNTATPIVPDNVYDALYQYASMAFPDDTYFLGIGSAVRGGKIKLPFPMGSLTQAYVGDFESWIAKYDLQNKKIVISDKLDGYSALIVYDASGDMQIAYSRGDGVEGADITRHILKIAAVPKNVGQGLVIRAEVIISKSAFPGARSKMLTRGGTPYKNPRNMVSGLMNSSENPPAIYSSIDVIGYEIIEPVMSKSQQLKVLKSVGFSVVDHMCCDGNISEEQLTVHLNEQRTKSAYELDGVVIDVDDIKLRKQINPTKDTLNPEYARKFKVADASNIAVATVVEVQWNISKDGMLKPRVKIEPTELMGVTIQHASGFNAKFINDNGIGPGAQIRITRSGDVIPLILAVMSPVIPQLPAEQCEWNATGVDLVLTDLNNDTVKVEQLIDFTSKMGFDHIGAGNVEAIFNAGITTPQDLILATEQEIAGAIGSKVNGKKIFKSIHEKLTNVLEWQLMGSFPGFGRGIGRRKFKLLYETFEGDMTKCASIADVASVHGFDHKSAVKIANGYSEYVAFMASVAKFVSIQKFEKVAEGPLTGQTFVMTGFRDAAMEQTIVQNGGKVGSAVSAKTSCVIAADPSESSGKLTKARDLGIKIVSIEQFRSML